MQIKTTMRYHLTPIRMLLTKRQQITIVGEDVEKREPCTLLVGCIWIYAATMENSMESFQKVKNRTTIQSSNSSPGYLSGENINTNLKRYMHT